MPVNTPELNTSPYTITDFAQRSNNDLYKRVRGYAIALTPAGKTILDIGCSDLPASEQLTQENRVIGLDLDSRALLSARSRQTRASLVCADLNRLPLAENNQISTVLLLDVLEHLTRPQAVGLLNELRRINLDLRHVIVSMPIISPRTVPTWVEGIRALINREKPMTGLFDRTHQIFTDSSGHKKIFEHANYQVLAEDRTYWGLPGTEPLKRVARFGINRVIPALVNPTGSHQDRESVRRKLNEYQGIYIITP